MNDNGYVVLPQFLDGRALQAGKDVFSDSDIVDYIALRTFADDTVKRVGRNLEWTQPDYVKVRASDNNNATDAGALHRDVISLVSGPPPAQIFTVLAYLDAGTCEVVPRSQQTTSLSYPDAISKFTSRVKISLIAGDVLVISSFLLHRGIFTARGDARRRLVQIFEVCADKPRCAALASTSHNLPALNAEQDTIAWVLMRSAHLPVINELVNVVGYVNAATGHGIERGCSYTDADMLSSEARRPRYSAARGRWQASNLYLIKRPGVDVTEVQMRRLLEWQLFNRQYVSYMALVVIACVSAYVIIKRRRTSK